MAVERDTRVAACVLELGVTICGTCRTADAECVMDPGERFARPLCFDCVEDEVERELAQVESPHFGELLDRARKDVRYKPLPAPVVRLEDLDHSKLNALQKSWAAYRLKVSEAARCWAILPDGGRCSRQAASEGVCETHMAVGCRLPGLGWRDGVPQGRMVRREGRGRRAA